MKRTGLALTLTMALGLGLGVGGAHAGGGHAHGGDHGHAHGEHDHGGHGHAHGAGPEEPDPLQAHARHGGVVLEEDGRLFEVAFGDHGVRVQPMTGEGVPRPVEGLRGTVLLRGRRGRRIRLTLDRELGADGHPGHLNAEEDLSRIRDGSRTAIFTLRGLPGKSSTTFWTRFERTRAHGHHGEHGDGHGHTHGTPDGHGDDHRGHHEGHRRGGGHGHDH